MPLPPFVSSVAAPGGYFFAVFAWRRQLHRTACRPGPAHPPAILLARPVVSLFCLRSVKALIWFICTHQHQVSRRVSACVSVLVFLFLCLFSVCVYVCMSTCLQVIQHVFLRCQNYPELTLCTQPANNLSEF